MRILITGSRDLRDYALVRGILSDYNGHYGPVVVVHGAATGADHLAHAAAKSLAMKPEPHFPDYDRYPPNEAPKKRNQLMVDLGADVCLAFPTKNSRGTWDCVNRAKAAGIPVKVFDAAWSASEEPT
jgi:hypothetical protein